MTFRMHAFFLAAIFVNLGQASAQTWRYEPDPALVRKVEEYLDEERRALRNPETLAPVRAALERKLNDHIDAWRQDEKRGKLPSDEDAERALVIRSWLKQAIKDFVTISGRRRGLETSISELEAKENKAIDGFMRNSRLLAKTGGGFTRRKWGHFRLSKWSSTPLSS